MIVSVLDGLQQRLGYRFRDDALLRQALTHRSFAAVHNERLEFLGDAILDLLVGEYLYRHYPSASEGELSHWRSRAVCGEQLAAIAQAVGLGECLYLGTGEQQSGGRTRTSILANALEAVLAAVYLDGGLEACARVAEVLLVPVLETAVRGCAKDAKTRLQEYLQARQLALPVYRLVSRTGSEHEACFTMACSVEAIGKSAEAAASSRKKAEQLAAAAILEQLGSDV